MTAAEDRKRHDAARELGAAARRANRRRADNPYRGYTREIRDQHYAWDAGWQAEDMARKAKR